MVYVYTDRSPPFGPLQAAVVLSLTAVRCPGESLAGASNSLKKLISHIGTLEIKPGHPVAICEMSLHPPNHVIQIPRPLLARGAQLQLLSGSHFTPLKSNRHLPWPLQSGPLLTAVSQQRPNAKRGGKKGSDIFKAEQLNTALSP